MTINFKDWQKSIKEALSQDVEIAEEISKSDVPAYLRKAKGEKPLTVADVKEPKKSTISAPANLAKARNEEVELDEAGKRQGMLGEPDLVGIPGPAKGTKPSPKAITKGSDREYYKAPGLGGTTRTTWRKKTYNEEVELDEAGKRQGMLGEPDLVGIPGPAKGTKPSPKAITKGSDREYYKAPGLGGTTRTTWRKKTYNEFVDKYSNFDGSKAVQEAETVDTGEGVQKEVPPKSVDKRADKKVAKDGRKYSTQIKFNDGEDDGKTIGEDFELDEETTYYMEAMIDYSDFQSKVDAHKKAGNKVVDYKHTPEKAHITTIDKEGTKRKVTYKPSGVSMQNLGKHEGDDSDHNGNKVKKTDNEPAIKRGRGRPSGAKSGARQSGSAKQEYRGLAFHSLNLPNKK